MLAQQRRSADKRERRPGEGRRFNLKFDNSGFHLTDTELIVLQRVADRLTVEVQQFYHRQERRRESDVMFIARWGKAVRHA